MYFFFKGRSWSFTVPSPLVSYRAILGGRRLIGGKSASNRRRGSRAPQLGPGTMFAPTVSVVRRKPGQKRGKVFGGATRHLLPFQA